MTGSLGKSEFCFSGNIEILENKIHWSSRDQSLSIK